jgi:RNA polymerase sigma-70 factor (ECF subfamily)
LASNAAEIIERHQKGVWRYLRMLGCDAATADDLTQEAFLRVLGKGDFVAVSDAATAMYLRRTAHNLMVSMIRRLGKVQLTDSVETLDEKWNRWAGADLSGDERLDALKNCLEKLTQRARQALRLRYADDVSRVEIGTALGISEHGARNLMQRAKQQLRECVEKQKS